MKWLREQGCEQSYAKKMLINQFQKYECKYKFTFRIDNIWFDVKVENRNRLLFACLCLWNTPLFDAGCYACDSMIKQIDRKHSV